MFNLLEIFIPSMRHRRTHENYMRECEQQYYKSQKEGLDEDTHKQSK